VEENGGVTIPILVSPRASKNQIVAVVEGGLKVRIASPPVDGAANKELIGFLAKTFKRPKSAVTILFGDTGKHKRVHIGGINATIINEFIALL
jgi:hypothetical protein